MTTPTPDPNARREIRRLRQVRGRSGARRPLPSPRVAAKQVARVPVRAVRRPASAVASMVRYWRAERRTLRQGFAALSISSAGDLLAGLALGAMSGRLAELPSLLILVPAAIAMRGNIFGALGSRLGTSIHAGLFAYTRERSGVLYQNAYAAIVLSILSSLYLAAGARLVAAASGLPSISFWDFVAVSVVGGVLSSAVVLALTIVLAHTASQRDWDMDSVAGPVVTFIGDAVTLPALFLASYLVAHGNVTTLVGILLAAGSLWAAWLAARTDLPIARRILKESLFVLALCGVIVLAAGVVVEHRVDRFLALPALLIMMPSFLEDAGALGAILSSRLASKLHLGSVRPRLIPERLAILDITLAAPFALGVFTLVGVSAHLVAEALGKASPGLWTMIAVALTAGFLATLAAAAISYAAAVASFRFGMDPDNHTIPVVTSTIDLLGVIALVGTVVLLGVR